MKKLPFILPFLILLVSCQDVKRSPKPENLIPEEKMVNVLTEVAIMQGARSYSKKLMAEKGIAPYAHLTQKFGIDSLQLLSSNNYYAEHPRVYERIYERVKRKLEIMQVTYDSLREIEERKQDSLNSLQLELSDEQLQARLDSLGLDTSVSKNPPVNLLKFDTLSEDF